MTLKTPILFLVFNRPVATRKVFEKIRQARPERLFVAADGPRDTKEGEFDLCEETRNIIRQGIDWPCELFTLFRRQNEGCGKGVSNAINWFFEQEEEGIILEDDCLPDLSFFSFCSEMLERYRNNEKVMHVSGNNFQGGIIRGDGDYYFSVFIHIWGWATWRRAWHMYDFEMKDYDSEKTKQFLRILFRNRLAQDYWANLFNQAHAGNIDTWDYQWVFTIWQRFGLAILPQKNLVSNIGFGNNATHTHDQDHILAGIPVHSLDVKTHPREIKVSVPADVFTLKNVYGISQPDTNSFMRSLIIRTKNRLKSWL